MKVLSIRQPYASLIILGFKDVENRSWSTKHRGALAIHASAAAPSVHDVDYATEILRTTGHGTAAVSLLTAFDHRALRRGAIIGVVDLVDVVEGHPSPWAEGASAHWVLARPRRLAKPIEVKGRLNLWEHEVKDPNGRTP